MIWNYLIAFVTWKSLSEAFLEIMYIFYHRLRAPVSYFHILVENFIIWIWIYRYPPSNPRYQSNLSTFSPRGATQTSSTSSKQSNGSIGRHLPWCSRTRTLARQFRCYIRQFKISNENLTMKKRKTGKTMIWPNCLKFKIAE